MSNWRVTRCGVAAAAVGVVIAAVGSGTPAIAAAGGGGCLLQGTAVFSPNGPGTQDTFGYGFTGTLSNCQSTVAGAPTGGTIGAGQALTEAVTLTNPDGTTSTGTAKYQEPSPTGTTNVPGASCASGATQGIAVTQWSDKSTTVISYTTQSVVAGVSLSGTVVPSVQLTLVPGSESVTGAAAPATYTLASNSAAAPVGNSAQGLLTFQVTDPTQCTTASGVSTAGISGVVGIGSAS